jgi:hypothetical protein
MIVDETAYKTVFFLGAGASRGAVDHVLLDQKRIKPPLNNDFFKIAATFARAHGKNSAPEQRLKRLLRVFTRDMPAKGMPSMEEAFSLLYVAKDFPEIFNRGRGRQPVAGERKEISDFLRLLFPILALLDQGNNHKTAYDRLAGNLSDGDTLITLNYDTMLDSALHRRGWDPKKGYSIGGDTARKVKWSRDSSTDQILDVQLLKLHGSMNWFVGGEVTNLKKVFTSKPVRITKPRSNELAKHIRQIAPPIYGKIFEHEHWQHLWTEAFHALCAAEVIVVVGCSLIDTDFHLRALLSQVARTRKKKDDRFSYACFVDKTKVRRKWQAVLKGSFLRKGEYSDFQKFLSQKLGV